MADTSIYRGITLVANSTGAGGIAMTNDFQELANRDGPVYSGTTDPTISNGSPNYYIWSKWLNTTTKGVFICADATPGSAKWIKINYLAGDKTPSLSNNFNLMNYGITNIGSLSSSLSMSITSTSIVLASNGSISVQGNLLNVGSIAFSNGSRTITATDITLSGVVKIGSLKFPAHDGMPGNCLGTDGANNINWFSGEAFPVGSIMCWSTAVAPFGWLICDGSNVSRITYMDLFNVIGTTYGSGDGLTFGLPNFKGKMGIGTDTSDANFNNLNSPTTYVGTKTVLLDIPNLPSHTHTFPGSSGVGSGYGGRPSHSVAPNWGTIMQIYSQTAHNNIPHYVVMNFIIRV